MEQPPYDVQRMGKYVGVGLALGTSAGIVIGTVLDSIAMGVAFGASIAHFGVPSDRLHYRLQRAK